MRWRPGAAALYGASAVLALPYIYALVVVDWDNEFVDPLACWVGNPTMLLLVPTCSFLFDLWAGAPPELCLYALRSAAEVLVLVPLWGSFWVLGWVWV